MKKQKNLFSRLLASLPVVALMFVCAFPASAATSQVRSEEGYSITSAAAITFQLNVYTWDTPKAGDPIKAYENIYGDNSQRWDNNDRYMRCAADTNLVLTRNGNETILTNCGSNNYDSILTTYDNGAGYDRYRLLSFELALDPTSTMLQIDDYYNGANISFSISNGQMNQRWYQGMYY